MPHTFVLVHGAWHGGWCWRRVADILRRDGPLVFTPTLSGLGADSHRLDHSIRLATHIADVVNLLKWEELKDVVLCGHSYGGMVISGVAEEMHPAIRSILFLDAFLPEDGDSLIERGNPAMRPRIQKELDARSPGIPPFPAAFFKVNENDQAWVDAKCTPHPTMTFVDPVALTGAREKIARKTYIRAPAYPNPVFDAAREKLARDPSWRVIDVACGHDVMVDAPQELAAILLAAA
jgi:pimeloyl-ACP methyl ester carboxylesterase